MRTAFPEENDDEMDYHDPRSALWRRCFDAAAEYDTYLANSPQDKADKWRRMEPHIPALTDAQRQRVSGFNRKMNVLVISGVWCGDCVRQVPMMKRIAEAAPGTQTHLRIIDREADLELREELRIVGAMRVPMVVFLSEDFWELGRHGDRSLTAYRAKYARETGAACSTGLFAPPPEELAAEQEEWLAAFELSLLKLRLSPPLRQRYGD